MPFLGGPDFVPLGGVDVAVDQRTPVVVGDRLGPLGIATDECVE